MPAAFLLAVGTDRDSSGGVAPHGAEIQAVLTVRWKHHCLEELSATGEPKCSEDNVPFLLTNR